MGADDRIEPFELHITDAGTVFPKEIFRPSRRWADQTHSDIRYWSEPAVGGHFAAFEQPSLFVDEVRAAFRTMR